MSVNRWRRIGSAFTKTVVALSLAVCLAVSLAGSDGIVRASNTPLTIAVLPFDFSGGSQWRGVDVGQQVSDLVTANLVNQGNFLIVERSLIEDIIDEQDFGVSGRVDPSRAAEIGRLLGADALILGSVTRFEYSTGAGLSAFGVSLRSTSAKVELTGRVVDTSQGVVRGAISVEGSGSGLGIDVKNLEGISFSATQFQESALGKATVEATKKFAENAGKTIEEQLDDILAAKAPAEIRGTVLALIDQGVVVNIGADHGVRTGQELRVYRMMEVPGLSEPVRIPVGTVRVISVDAGASVALFESMTQPAQVGDQVGTQ